MPNRSFLPFLLVALAAACSTSDNPTTPTAPTASSGQQPNAAAPAKDPLTAVKAFIAEQKIDKSGQWKTHLPKPPKLTFDGRTYYWNLRTNKGPVKVKLMPDVAPMHVSSTIYLTELGFYDGLAFHRVIPGFMAQGGDPLGNGLGAPGYAYDGEFDDKLRHDRPGLLSMAHRGAGTDGSQFFLTFAPAPWLDGKHTIFGEVVEGMDTLKALEKCGTKPQGATTEPLSIEAAAITTE